MSQPKRYTTDVGYGHEDEDGEFVLWDDYLALYADKEHMESVLEEENAALAAEKEALVQQGIRDHGDWRSKLNFLEADYKAEIARLKAENERLRKSGDAMAFNYEQMHSHDGVYDSDLMKYVNAWNAAKEGRDAK